MNASLRPLETARPSVFRVARSIVEQLGGSVVQMKLHKLLYYAQAASLVWRDRKLFDAQIEAWANGPVIADLWAANRYQGVVSLDDLPNEGPELSDEDERCVKSVLDAYGKLSGYELSMQTHGESPWLNARQALKTGEYGRQQIPAEAMRDFYLKAWS